MCNRAIKGETLKHFLRAENPEWICKCGQPETECICHEFACCTNCENGIHPPPPICENCGFDEHGILSHWMPKD